MGDFAWSWKEFLKAFLPIKGNAYWFGTMYIGLYLLHPYLNRMITGGGQNRCSEINWSADCTLFGIFFRR